MKPSKYAKQQRQAERAKRNPRPNTAPTYDLMTMVMEHGSEYMLYSMDKYTAKTLVGQIWQKDYEYQDGTQGRNTDIVVNWDEFSQNCNYGHEFDWVFVYGPRKVYDHRTREYYYYLKVGVRSLDDWDYDLEVHYPEHEFYDTEILEIHQNIVQYIRLRAISGKVNHKTLFRGIIKNVDLKGKVLDPEA